MAPSSPKKILFICTGNTCRSALAENLLRHKLGAKKLTGYEVKSAGVGAHPDQRSPKELLKTLEDRGVDGSAHRSQLLTGELVDWADVILTMESRHQMTTAMRFPRSVGKVHVFKSWVGAPPPRDVPDPIGRPQDVYDACAEVIDAALENLLAKLAAPPPAR